MDGLEALNIDGPRLDRLIEMAREEDLGSRGDLTSAAATGPGVGERSVQGVLRVKQDGVLCGLCIAPRILAAYDGGLQLGSAGAADGDMLAAGSTAATVSGPLRALLACERVLLNFLQRLSGVASLTRRFVDRVQGTAAEIYDTRKTTPGWRDLERYAVRCGGGRNHRRGLHDAVLVKENHLVGVDPRRLAQHAFELLNEVSELQPPPSFVEFEVESLEQFEQLLKVVGIDVIMLDNFQPADMRRAVALRDEHGLRGKIQIEASGNVALQNVRAIAETGVDRISIGALTHSATALDCSMEIA